MRTPLFFLLVIYSGLEMEAEVLQFLQCDRIVNEQIHSLKVRRVLYHLL